MTEKYLQKAVKASVRSEDVMRTGKPPFHYFNPNPKTLPKKTGRPPFDYFNPNPSKIKRLHGYYKVQEALIETIKATLNKLEPTERRMILDSIQREFAFERFVVQNSRTFHEGDQYIGHPNPPKQI